jgi:2-polyprenyl-6-methoxyphenol hydroxylase-like FAD-dependent oxidoreductase
MSANANASQTTTLIAGGGPAGMVLAFLLARAGIEVLVLEKHADFFRDFRGDTIHPSTFQLVYELGLLDDFLRVPHQELREIGAVIDDFSVTVAEFSHLPVHCKFVGLMPQWDFLNFIRDKARAYPQFHLQMETEVTDLIIENDRVAGVLAKTKSGEQKFRAALTIGADGRRSIVREKGGLEVHDLGAPIDVLWMRVSRQPGDPAQTLGRFRAGKILVTLNREDYWQCAYVIPKGAFPAIQQKGLPAFRDELESVAPFLQGRAVELKDWTDIKLLSVALDRLRNWSRPGLLCIGDSAHAMSPIGGVGINLAIQDAVAAANALAHPLSQLSQSLAQRSAQPSSQQSSQQSPPAALDPNLAALDAHLHKVQDRRTFPTRMTQALQVQAHKRFIGPALALKAPITKLPLPLLLLKNFPILRRIPARIVGLGFRPEHVHTLDSHS